AIETIGEEFPDVEVDYNHIDAATIYMVTDPSRYDVIVTDNLFGDILTDLASAVTGGIGLAASGNIDTTHNTPSLSEPVHGSVTDVAVHGIADPCAAILSVALMLRHLGDEANAEKIEKAVLGEAAGRDGSPIRTTEVGDRIAAAVQA